MVTELVSGYEIDGTTLSLANGNIISFNTANANTWTATQTFGAIALNASWQAKNTVITLNQTAYYGNGSFTFVKGPQTITPFNVEIDLEYVESGNGQQESFNFNISDAFNSPFAAFSINAIAASSGAGFSYSITTAKNTLDDGSGNMTLAGALHLNTAQTTITGTTAGSAVASMPEQGSSYKKAIVYLDAYENDTAKAQTYTFPVAFTNTPVISTNSANIPGVTVSTTALSLAPDTTTAYTGWIIIEGY